MTHQSLPDREQSSNHTLGEAGLSKAVDYSSRLIGLCIFFGAYMSYLVPPLRSSLSHPAPWQQLLACSITFVLIVLPLTKQVLTGAQRGQIMLWTMMCYIVVVMLKKEGLHSPLGVMIPAVPIGGVLLSGQRGAIVSASIAGAYVISLMFAHTRGWVVPTQQELGDPLLMVRGVTILLMIFAVTIVCLVYERMHFKHTSLIKKQHEDLASNFEQLREQNEALERARSEAEAANRMKSAFLANMSHELRTPMNAIVGLSRLLLKSKLPPRERKNVATILTSSDTLKQLVDDILDLSKIEAGMLTFEHISLDLRGLLSDIVAVFRANVIAKQIDLTLLISRDVPERIVGDPLRLRQILFNLLSNALKFTEQGEVILDVSMVPGADDEQTGIRFSVKDTGIGIAPQAISRLLEAFVQADQSTSRKYGGSGLGLAISQKLLSLMDTSLQVESTPGTGSEFSFVLAAQRAEEATLWTRVIQGLSEDHWTLVLSDMPSGQRQMSLLLDSFGLRFELVSDLQKALDILAIAEEEQRKPDLILLNWSLANGGGLQELAFLQKWRPARQIPVILCGTHSEQEDAIAALGVDDFLQKPIIETSLFHSLHLLLTGESTPFMTPNPSNPKQGWLRDVHILVAEDNKINQHVIQEFFHDTGVLLDFVDNGKEAVEQAFAKPYAMVLMDVQMDTLNGLEATQELRAAGFTIPIIAVTASVMADDIRQCKDAGMDDYVPKPIDITHLFEVLERWLPASIKRDAPHALPQDALGHLPPAAFVQEEPDGSLWKALVGLQTINAKEALTRMRTTPERLYSLLQQFHRKVEEASGTIRQAMLTEALDVVVFQAHSIAGTAGMLCATPLYDAAKALEQAARQHIPEGQAPLLAFHKASKDLTEEFSAFVASVDKGKDTQMPDVDFASSQFCELLEQLESAIEKADLIVLLNVIEKIAAFPLPSSLQSRVQALVDHVNNFDFDDASEEIRHLRALR